MSKLVTNYQTIRADYEAHPSAHFAKLREKALQYVQEASGTLWTDYNIHDPGVTILESFCYAITDVSYRISLDIQDLLLHSGHVTRVFSSHLLLTPEKVFKPRATTVEDYRLLILDYFADEITQAYVYAIDRDANGIRGLYDIEIIPTYDLSEEQKIDLINRIKAQWILHRSIGEDLNDITILQSQRIAFDAKLVISDQVDVHEVLAQLLFELRNFVQPSIQFKSYQQLKDEGKNELDIFNIPSFKNGFIDRTSLLPKRSVFQRSQFRQLFSRIKGIRELYQFQVTVDGVLQREEWIKIPSEAYLNLIMDKLADWEWWNLEVIQYGKWLKPDLKRVQSIFQKLVQQQKAKNIHVFNSTPLPAESQIAKKDIVSYKPIAYDLPGIYRVGNYIPAENEALSVKASSKQLSDYLSFFDDLLQDYLYLLSELESLYSIDETSEDYPNRLRIKSDLTYHLLARFGETWYSTSSEKNSKSDELSYMQQFLQFTRDEGMFSTAAFRYYTLNKEQHRFPFKERIDLKTSLKCKGIQQLTPSKTIDDHIDYVNEEESIDSEGIHLVLPEYAEGKFLLRYASEPTRYAISKKRGEEVYYLYFDSPLDTEPQIVAKSNDKGIVEQLLHKITQKLIELNEASDGFHLIEHILLRPQQRRKASFFLSDDDSDVFESLIDDLPDKQYDLAKDAALLACYENNYKVIPTADNDYRVIIKDLTGKSRAKSVDRFMTQVAAEDFITIIRTYFIRLKKEEKLNECIRIESPKIFKLFVLNKVGDPIFETKKLYGFEELQKLQSHLVEGLKISEHFSIRSINNQTSEVVVEIAKKELVSLVKFDSEERALLFIEQVKRQFRESRLITDASIFFRLESITAANADDYSYKVSLVIPNWTKRFQQENEIQKLVGIAESELPAYIKLNVLKLSSSEMADFEKIYFDWMVALEKSTTDESSYERLNVLSSAILATLTQSNEESSYV